MEKTFRKIKMINERLMKLKKKIFIAAVLSAAMMLRCPVSAEAPSSASNTFTAKEVSVKNLEAKAISISSIKLTWTADKGREYKIGVVTSAPYTENIRIIKKQDGYYYLTGLRENSEYSITVTPQLMPNEKMLSYKANENSVTAKTRDEHLYWEYQKEEGWTNCFAGERASGLTASPAKECIEGTIVDPVTNTGIRRNEYGDYCCAMGLWYGVDGDRFLVELENGTQFTVEMCDSKGMADDANGDGILDGRFHWFGSEQEGKCIVEFIYDDNYLPASVSKSGSWGFENWNGLDLTANVSHIYRIGYGTPTEY